MSFQVSIIPSGHVCNVLVEVLPMLHKAAKVTNGRMTTDDVLAEILTGQSLMWIAFDSDASNKIYGVLLTKVTGYYRKRLLTVSFCAGERASEWMDSMVRRLFQFGRDQKCDGIEWTGRRGWERFLSKYGLKVKYSLFETSIDDAEASADAHAANAA